MVETETLLKVVAIEFLGFAAILVVAGMISLLAPFQIGQEGRPFHDAMVKVFAILASFGAASGFFAAQQATRVIANVVTWKGDTSEEKFLDLAEKLNDSVHRVILFFLLVSALGLVVALLELASSGPTTPLMFSEFSFLVGTMFLMFGSLVILLYLCYGLSRIAPSSRGPTPIDRQMGRYFVKNLLVHRYPVPSNCKVKYERERLYNSPPDGYEKCDDCWPELPR